MKQKLWGSLKRTWDHRVDCWTATGSSFIWRKGYNKFGHPGHTIWND